MEILGSSDLLLVIDVQNDFVSDGALAVPDGEQVVPVINRVAKKFANVVLTQDWHTPKHISFASSHPGKKPFETLSLPYGEQVLWPDHCVQGTYGAELHTELFIPHAQLIIRKGYQREVDSYSAFLEADRCTVTGLEGFLRAKAIKRIYCAGLATDFCVAWSALDACNLGFTTLVIEDACRAIDNQGSLAAAWAKMVSAGVRKIDSAQLLVPVSNL